MSPETITPARADALAELAAEAARFAAGPPEVVPVGAPAHPGRRESRPGVPRTGAPGDIPAYVPNAVAPERGNTRPLVPVDGRLHLRAAPAMIAALDDAVRRLRHADPAGLRDLERATLVRIGLGVVLADLAANGSAGVVGEAVRAALDPAQRHLDVPMPDPRRWLRSQPAPAP